MAPEIIEPDFDLTTQEARELARRATVPPPDAPQPEMVIGEPEQAEPEQSEAQGGE